MRRARIPAHLYVGAAVENFEDLTPLQAFLSPRDMLLILRNAESALEKSKGLRDEFQVDINVDRYPTAR